MPQTLGILKAPCIPGSTQSSDGEEQRACRENFAGCRQTGRKQGLSRAPWEGGGVTRVRGGTGQALTGAACSGKAPRGDHSVEALFGVFQEGKENRQKVQSVTQRRQDTARGLWKTPPSARLAQG